MPIPHLIQVLIFFHVMDCSLPYLLQVIKNDFLSIQGPELWAHDHSLLHVEIGHQNLDDYPGVLAASLHDEREERRRGRESQMSTQFPDQSFSRLPSEGKTPDKRSRKEVRGGFNAISNDSLKFQAWNELKRTTSTSKWLSRRSITTGEQALGIILARR